MKTAFNTGPGFYAAESRKSNKKIPKGIMRFYMCRLEAYDDKITNVDNKTSFEILFNKAVGNPEVARALLLLMDTIKSNEEFLKEEANK